MPGHDHSRMTFIAIKIAGIYALAGIAWILFSDRILLVFVQDPFLITRLQTFKGWLFVVLTTALLYGVVSYYLREVDRAHTRARESEERMRWALEATNDGIWDVDMVTGEVYLSPRTLEILGYDREELAGDVSLWSELVHPDDMSATIEQVRDHQEGRTGLFGVEHRLRMKSGEWKWIYARGKIVSRDSNGTPLRMTGTYTDVSAKKIAEERLLKSEARFRRLAENAQDMIYRMSLPDGAYEYVSPSSAKLMGYEPDEFYSSPLLIRKAIHPDWDGYFRDAWSKLIAGVAPERYEYQIIHKSGAIRWLNQRNILVRDDGGNPVAIEGIATDVTDRKEAELRIIRLTRLYAVLSRINEVIVRTGEQEKLFEQVCSVAVEDGPFRMAWIGMIDPATLVVNPVAMKGIEEGYLRENPISADGADHEGKGPTGLAIRKKGYAICNDIEHDPVMEPWRTAALARGYHSSAAFVLRKGAEVIGALTVYSGDVDFFRREEEVSLLIRLADDISYAIDSIETEKRRREAEESLRRLTEELEKRVAQRTAEYRDSRIALLNLVDDLNAKSEELAEANIRLQELDRLKSMFIASMSHELRTPLNSIIGFTGIILMGMSGEISDIQRKQLSMVKNSANHLLALINDVIDVSKIEAGRIDLFYEDFDLSYLVFEVRDSFQVGAEEKNLRLNVITHEGVMIRSDRRRVKQILVNLVGNAVKFTSAGAIVVAVEEEGNQVRVSIRDGGVGMKAEDMGRLFEPFSRILIEGRPLVEGTGLGLYLSKRIAVLLGGNIRAESQFGKGSTFTCVLPVEIGGKGNEDDSDHRG